MSVETAYDYLYTGALIWLSVLILFMLVRSIMGPRITDRLLAINMIGTLVISCIAVLSRLLDESYLIDAALIYAMISFVSVLILAMIYIPVRQTRGKFEKDARKEIRAERGIRGSVTESGSPEYKAGKEAEKPAYEKGNEGLDNGRDTQQDASLQEKGGSRT